MNRIGIKQLMKKRDELISWLGDRLEKLRVLRRRRDDDLSLSRRAIESARQESERLHILQDEREAEAEARIELAEAAIAEGQRLLGLAKMERQDAWRMETGEDGILAAQQLQREEHIAWRDRMRSEQDGRTRRKRGELAKIVRRLEQRQDEASRRHPTAEEIQYGGGLNPEHGTGQIKEKSDAAPSPADSGVPA